MNADRAVRALLCLLGLAALSMQTLLASNGMNMIGYGAESIAMGGADLAVTDNPSSMNINPAGLAWCEQPEFDFGITFMNPSLTHTDELGNNVDDSLDRTPMPFIGYVHPVGKFTAGVGLFLQGGLGVEYDGLVTPFSARRNSGMPFPPGFWDLSDVPDTDTIKTELANVRLTPAFGWRITDHLSVGATINLTYAQADMQFFPESSVLADFNQSGTPGDAPGEMFAGMRVDDVSAYGIGLRLGVQYKKDKLSIGGAYSTKTDLDFDGGTATLYLPPPQIGKVTYDADMVNFAWPRQLGAGFSYQVTPGILIASDLDWVNWSSAIKNPTIRLTNPDHPMAPSTREITMPMNWDDQWVWALGFEIVAGPRWVARAGFNHGKMPVPGDMLRPQFPAIAENHLTGGFGYSTGPWILDFALEYVLESEKTNNNPDMTVNPLGPGSTETLSQIAAHFMMRRTFGAKRN